MRMRFSALMVFLMGAWLAGSQRALPAQGLTANDYQVESGYLLEFADFTEWPAHSAAGKTTIDFCVLGKDPYGELLDSTLLGHSVGNHRTMIERGEHLRDMGRCEVLFISSSKSKNESEILERLRYSQVLTVGNTEGFAKRGGIIQFVKKQGHVRFLINVDAARRAGLKINASLLALATIVRDSPAKGGT